MNYRLIHSSIKGKGRNGSWRIAFVFLALLVLFYFAPPRFLKEGAATVALPFWRARLWVGDRFAALFGFFSSRQKLLTELQFLKEEVAAREQAVRERAALLDENTALKEERRRSPNTQAVLIAAVLATPPRSPYDSVILDAGARDGVSLGDEVSGGGVLVGRISEVLAQTSVVSLFSSPGSRVSLILVHNDIALSVEAEGQGAGALLARLPREVSLAEGDAAHLSDYPFAPFAHIAAIVASETSPFKNVYITSLVPLRALRLLSIHL